MTNKFLLNRSGMSPEVTCRKGRHAIESIVSRLCLASLICLCMLTVGVGQMWGSSPASTTMQSVVTANSYEVSVDNTIGTKCLSIDLDDNINISINSGGNNGTFWGTGASINWRGYQAQSGTYTLTAKNGCTLSSVTFTFSISNGGTLNTNSNGNNIAAGYRLVSGTALSLSGTSKTLYVGNTNSTGSNLGKGQVRITAISVSYSAGVSCSTNPTAGSASLNGSFLWTAYFIARKPFCRAA